jgi:hypothetical protein
MRSLVITLTLAVMALGSQTCQPLIHINTTPLTMQVPAGTGGLLYVNPLNVTGQPVNQFNVSIQVAGMQFFTGWDISVETNASTIDPIKLTTAGNLFEANYSLSPSLETSCIDNKGTGCASPRQDDQGIAHSVFQVPGTSNIHTPIFGRLFVITYNVTNNSGYSKIRIVNDTLVANSTSRPVPHSEQDGIYSGLKPPDFAVSLSTRSLTLVQGSQASLTVTLVSASRFNGTVHLAFNNYDTGGNSSSNLTGIFEHPSLELTATAGANSTVLTLTAPENSSTELHNAIVLASYKTITHYASLQVNVQPAPYFVLDLSPAQLEIRVGTSGTTTILLTSQFNFTGEVELVTAPAETGMAYSLETPTLTLRPYQSNSTILTVSIDAKASIGNYTVLITANWLGNDGHASNPQHGTLRVTVDNPTPLHVSSAPTSLDLVDVFYAVFGVMVILITIISIRVYQRRLNRGISSKKV